MHDPSPDIVRIKHMLDIAKEIIDFSKNKSREDLDLDRKLTLSLIHLLEIFGEAANGISSEFQSKYSNIPWKFIIGMRNRLIHGYYDIDLDVIWSTVTEDIPPLEEKIKIIVEKIDNKK
ncbi:MAG: DUF86 domain-containing protein [Candidatus Methanofastidiosa archaeon]|nr:DUF86 domain-containing protein [Candidatus Methanofastidiosa archaeon]